MFDIGVNLLHPQFESDRAAVLDRATQAGVLGMLVTATDLDSTRAAIDFCTANGLFCTAGVHPHDAARAPVDIEDQLIDLSRAPCVKAIGETGLDFNRDFSPRPVQRQIFERQIQVAAKVRLPLFVHDRDSNGETGALLAAAMPDLYGVIVHCFTGTASELDSYLEMGCSIGVTGWICDRRRGASLRELITRIPLERLLIETDAPFLLPHNAPADWHARLEVRAPKRRNEPALLCYVAEEIARLRGEPQDLIEQQTLANARALFRIEEPGGQ